jgi:hypothetical protein
MRNRPYLLLILLTASLACGGGGGGGGSESSSVSGGGGGSGSLTAFFSPDNVAPGADSVTMAEGTLSGNRVTVDVNVTDTNNVYGAAFDITFDNSMMQFDSWSPGNLLESGGHTPNYIVDQPTGGRLVVAASRVGGVSPVNAVGSRALIRLTFRATQPGTGIVAFQNGTIQDDTPQDLPNLTWDGGSVGAN